MKLDSAVFYSNDIDKVTDFYKNIIGLEVVYKREDKFVSFKLSNGVKLGIKKAIEEREKPGAQTIFIAVDNIEEQYEKFKNLDSTFYKELKVESWGKEFAILDPDGNKLEFVQSK